MRPAFTTRLFLTVFCVLILGASMLMGVFGAAGLCALIWGSSILDTALGDPPNRSHPAFITFLLVALPGMLVGGIGGMAGVLLPLFSYFGIRCTDVPWFFSPASVKSIRDQAHKILRTTEAGNTEEEPRSPRPGPPA